MRLPALKRMDGRVRFCSKSNESYRTKCRQNRDMRHLITLLLSAACACAAPAWEAELSPIKRGVHPPITPSTIDFSLSWKGMLNAGSLRIEFAPKGEKKQGVFVIKSSASSKGAASTLFPYSHSYWAEIDPASLGSRYFHATETDSKESVVTSNRYGSSKVAVHEVTTDTKSGGTATKSLSFPYGSARDMFSTILYIRSQKLDPGDQHTLLLIPFTTPYLLKVTVEAKERHLGRDCLRLSFALQKINRKTLELGVYKKLKKPATLWLSDDADRIPIELRAAAYIGDVRAIMTGFTKE